MSFNNKVLYASLFLMLAEDFFLGKYFIFIDFYVDIGLTV